MAQVVGQNRCTAFERGGWSNSLKQYNGEAAFGVENGSPDYRAMFVNSDGFGVDLENDIFSVDVQDCTVNAPRKVKTGDTVQGQIVVPLFPTFTKLGLDIAMGRASNGELKSWTFRRHESVDATDTAGGIGYKFLGGKCSTFTFAVGQDNPIPTLTLNMIARERTPLTSVPSETFTGLSPYLFKNGRFVMYDDRTGETIAAGQVESMTIEGNNNIEVGPKKRRFQESPPSTSDGEYSGLAASLRAGRLDVTGSMTLLFETARWDRVVSAYSKLIVYLMFVHPDSQRARSNKQSDRAVGATIFANTFSPGVIESPALRTSPGESDVWVFEGNDIGNTSPLDYRSAFNHVATSPLTWSPGSSPLDGNAVEGQSSWNVQDPGGLRWALGMSPGYTMSRCFGIKLPAIRLRSAPKSGANTEIVRQTLNFDAEKNTVTAENLFGFSGEAFQYAARDYGYDLGN